MLVLDEAFAFISGLYFRGKLAYARAFARPPESDEGMAAALVIAPGRGLLSVDERVRREDLLAFKQVEVDEDNRAFRRPLLRDARRLARALDEGGEVVLLGSVATSKYTGVLREVLGERLRFPPAFVGRGDLSRGGLLLRAVRAGVELDYAPVGDGTHHGARPPKLLREL